MTLVLHVFLVVSPVLALVLIGYWLGSRRRYTIQALSDLTVYLTLPCLVFASLSRSSLQVSSMLTIGAAALFVIAGTGLAVAIYLRLSGRPDLRILYPSVMFVNAGNLALPLVQFAWGNSGFTKAVMFQAVSTSLMYTLGVYLVSGDRNLRKLFSLPFVYASAAGLGVTIGHVSIPGPLLDGVSFVGGAALPILLVMLGFELNKIKIKDLRIAAVGSGMRLGLGLALGLLFVALISVDPMSRKIIIFDAAMPAAVGAVVLGTRFDANPEVSASIVLMTTLISLVTIPLMLWLL
jgi:predicted permease